MNSEITKVMELAGLRGWVFYDGDCPLCCAGARRFENVLTRRGFDLAPLQTPWVAECLGLPTEEPLREMCVLSLSGRCFGGADAILFLARSIWWAWPLCAFAVLPGAKPLLRRLYGWVAERRHCLRGACALDRPSQAALSLPKEENP